MAVLIETLFPSVALFFGFLWSIAFWRWFHVIFFLYRYLRTVVHSVSHWRYRSKPIPEKPSYTSADVTVIIPTIHNAFEELRPSLQSILACKPAKLILVTPWYKFEALKQLAETLESAAGEDTVIELLSVDKANKRLQVCEALKDDHVKTRITVMADDDVEWPSTLLPWLLAPFENPEIGGVGTCQRVKRIWTGPLSTRVWNWLGAAYIERRNFEISATHNIDGGTSCMSGRTGAYRSEILKGHDFMEGFQTECWGKYTLNADDDNFVTRWLVARRWKTWIQYERECEIETTLENSPKFLYQCSRWARSNWRSNWTSLVLERHVLTQQPWCTYALHLATFTSLAFIGDPLILYSCWRATEGLSLEQRYYIFSLELVWMFCFTKVVKLVGLFRRNPSDIIFLPLSIVFGWFHGLIKLYALFTLKMTSWGSRADGDEHNNFRLQERPKRSQSMSMPPGPDLSPIPNMPQRRLVVPSSDPPAAIPRCDSLTSQSMLSEKSVLQKERLWRQETCRTTERCDDVNHIRRYESYDWGSRIHQILKATVTGQG